MAFLRRIAQNGLVCRLKNGHHKKKIFSVMPVSNAAADAVCANKKTVMHPFLERELERPNAPPKA
jgi:hypothetical protein